MMTPQTADQFVFLAIVQKYWRRFQAGTGIQALPQPPHFDILRDATNEVERRVQDTIWVHRKPALQLVVGAFVLSRRRARDVAVLYRHLQGVCKRGPNVLASLTLALAVQLNEPLLFWPELIPAAIKLEQGYELKEVFPWPRPQLFLVPPPKLLPA